MDMRYCSTCGSEYDALHEPSGHKCRLDQLQRAALAAYDNNQMEEYESLNRMIAAKIIGSHTSEAKAFSSRENGKLGGRPKKKAR